jgi:mannose/fructose/N-acetylgalactosamine-specific phosphotransferase system component IIC
MEWNLLLFCLIGGVVSADTDTFLQSMISQPLIACAFVGLLFDNFTLGLSVGMLMQLPFLAEIPVGARNLSFGNLGAFVASGLAVFWEEKAVANGNLILAGAILWGIFISYVTSPFLKFRRNFNLILVHRADLAAKTGSISRISLYHYLGVVVAFIFGVAYCWVFFLLGEQALSYVLDKIPPQIESNLVYTKPVLFGAGIGAMIYSFVNKKSLGFAGLGMIAAVLFLLLKSYL